MSYNQKHLRSAIKSNLKNKTYDITIIGGGINGAAVARDAAQRGYRVALVETKDFAYGTSSRSSRLIHGGLRYLEMGDIPLVFESVSERYQLSKLARHLVRPLPFIVPVYRGDKFPLFAINVGLWIYDALALFRNYRNHRRLSKNDVETNVPGIRSKDLRGAVHYYDYQSDDARLVLENILDAEQYGADILSYCQCMAINRNKSRTKDINLVDTIENETFTIRSHIVLIAGGPWTDELLKRSQHADETPWIRPSKGVHIVVPREKLTVDQALTLRHPQDGRVLFILPYHERTVIGTTDTDYQGNPGRIETMIEDVDYLLEAANYQFPQAELKRNDVISSWAGVRPLVRQKNSSSPSALSREHVIRSYNDGTVIIAGGKLTTYRKMAAECIDAFEKMLQEKGGSIPTHPCRTKTQPLLGSIGLKTDLDLRKIEKEILPFVNSDQIIATHLVEVYGVRARQIVLLIEKDKSLADRIDEELPYIWAEVVFSARHERVTTLIDFMIRRTHLFYRAVDQGMSTAEAIAKLIANEQHWDKDRLECEIKSFKEKLSRNRAWRKKA